MRDSLKIALGIILGGLSLVACLACVFFVLSMGGLALLSGSSASYSPLDLTPTAAPALISTATSSSSLLTPTGTPLPTASTTPIPLLAVGEWVQWDGMSLSVRRYEVTHTCPDGYGQSAEGAKFIVAYVELRNSSNDVMEIPSLRFELNGYESGLGAGLPCRYDGEAFGNACWQWSGKLYPEVTCEGWELFEVPENLALEESRIQIQKYDSASGQTEVIEWLMKGQ